MKTFLLEIGTEEMPHWAVEAGISQLKELFEKTLKENAIYFKNLRVFGGPRRLSIIGQVSERSEDRVIEVKGPPYDAAFDDKGKPTKTAEGFSKAQGVNLDELQVREVNGARYVFAVKKEEGIKTEKLLKKAVPDIILTLNFKKAMRWKDYSVRFIRPIRWLVCLFGSSVLDFEIASVVSGRKSRGHRFLVQEEIEIPEGTSYESILETKGKVIVDHKKRKERILNEAKKVCPEGAEPLMDENVLQEVVHLVEYPYAILGKFEERFLSLPEEVLITAMESHQRYFPVRKKVSGSLMPYFVVIHNGNPEFEDVIREGNERVIRARLEDATFFYEDDLKKPLESRVPALEGVIFQRKLGTLLEKVSRLQSLAGQIAGLFGYSKRIKEKAERAAYLSKADLLTSMVTEFPELQGIMGREYALKGGEDLEVAKAIYEHYLPRFPGDLLPETKVGIVLSIADRLDTVAGYFLCGLEPTGSEDPYSLRRQSQGAVQIILESDIDFNLEEALKLAIKGYENVKGLRDSKETFQSLFEFFRARLERMLIDKDYRPEHVYCISTRAMVAPSTSIKKLEIISRWAKDEKLDDILIPFQRVRNLSQPELGTSVDPSLFEEAYEEKLYQVYNRTYKSYSERELEKTLAKIADMRETIDTFFDKVLVMSEDKKIRENRLKLLNSLRALYEKYANFSALI